MKNGIQEPPPKSRVRRLVDYLVSQWFIFGLGVAVGLSAAYPALGKSHGLIQAQYTVKYGCIGAIFLITGLSLSTQVLITQARNIKLHVVTQSISFLLFSAFVYGMVAIIRASHTTKIDPIALAGLILMSVLPTTVASNIAMTRNAGGNVEATTIEVCIGNTIGRFRASASSPLGTNPPAGTFITPLLLSMYLQKRDGWGFIQPKAASGNGLVAIYKHMGIQLSISLFAPLIVGQLVQNMWSTQTRYWRERLRLNIIGQILLLLVIWSTFSDKFASGAFKAITHQSVILICFSGVGLYAFFTGVCLFITRLPFLGPQRANEGAWKKYLRTYRFGKKETTAICFCVAAKGLVLGAPLVSILYGGYDQRTQAIMSTPIALYQTTQVLLAQLSVKVFKAWIEISEPGPLDEEKGAADSDSGDATVAAGSEVEKHL